MAPFILSEGSRSAAIRTAPAPVIRHIPTPKPNGGGKWKIFALGAVAFVGIVGFISTRGLPNWMRPTKPTPPDPITRTRNPDCEKQIVACLKAQGFGRGSNASGSAFIDDWVRAVLQPLVMSAPFEYPTAIGYSFEHALCKLFNGGCQMTPECLKYFVNAYINPAIRASYPGARFNWEYFKACLRET